MYVRVLEKALLECRPDLAIEWVAEAHAWLTRRNELLIAHKSHSHSKEVKTATSKNIEVFWVTQAMVRFNFIGYS